MTRWRSPILTTVGSQESHSGTPDRRSRDDLPSPALRGRADRPVALCMVVSTRVKKARGKLRYESWHLIHPYGYLGAGLALPHQLWTGIDFMNNTAATVFWWGLWAVTALAVLVYRVGLPLWTSWRHDLRVAGVDRLAPDVVTVTVTGRDLHRLPVSAGQFFQWRFAGRGQTRAHPYSLSHAPDGRTHGPSSSPADGRYVAAGCRRTPRTSTMSARCATWCRTSPSTTCSCAARTAG